MFPLLTEEMVPAEDIKNVIQAVLTIQLPPFPDQIQTVFTNKSNNTNVQDDLTNVKAHTQIAQDLLQKAQELKSVYKHNSTCPYSPLSSVLKYRVWYYYHEEAFIIYSICTVTQRG